MCFWRRSGRQRQSKGHPPPSSCYAARHLSRFVLLGGGCRMRQRLRSNTWLQRLEAAQREMELVQSQVEGQSHKIVSYSSQFAELEAKIDLIQRTLQPLEAEKDKLQLLLSNCK